MEGDHSVPKKESVNLFHFSDSLWQLLQDPFGKCDKLRAVARIVPCDSCQGEVRTGPAYSDMIEDGSMQFVRVTAFE